MLQRESFLLLLSTLKWNSNPILSDKFVKVILFFCFLLIVSIIETNNFLNISVTLKIRNQRPHNKNIISCEVNLQIYCASNRKLKISPHFWTFFSTTYYSELKIYLLITALFFRKMIERSIAKVLELLPESILCILNLMWVTLL